MDKKPNEIHENLIPTKIKQPQYTVLNAKNKTNIQMSTKKILRNQACRPAAGVHLV